MRWLWLWAVVAAGDASAGAVERCTQTCNRVLTDPQLKSRLCGKCLTQGNEDRGAWAYALKDASPRTEQVDAVLKDDDWQVRWGGIRALAAIKGFTEARQLATWIVESGDPLRCITAIHLAGSRGTSTAALLKGAGTMGPGMSAVFASHGFDVRLADIDGDGDLVA